MYIWVAGVLTLVFVTVVGLLWKTDETKLKEFLTDPTSTASVQFAEEPFEGVGCIFFEDDGYPYLRMNKFDVPPVGNFSKIKIKDQIYSLAAKHCLEDVPKSQRTFLGLRSVPGLDVTYQSPKQTVKVDISGGSEIYKISPEEFNVDLDYTGFSFPVTKKNRIKDGDSLTILSFKDEGLSGIITPVKIFGKCLITEKNVFKNGGWNEIEKSQKVAILALTEEMFFWSPGLSGSPVLHNNEVVGVVIRRSFYDHYHCLIIELIQEDFFQ